MKLTDELSPDYRRETTNLPRRTTVVFATIAPPRAGKLHAKAVDEVNYQLRNTIIL